MFLDSIQSPGRIVDNSEATRNHPRQIRCSISPTTWVRSGSSDYAILGARDDAFQWLEKAYETHNPGLVSIQSHAAFDTLHSDPRYAALLKRMGLPQ